MEQVTELNISGKQITDILGIEYAASKLSEDTLKVISHLGDKPIQRQLLAHILYEITEDKIEPSREEILFEDIEESPYK